MLTALQSAKTQGRENHRHQPAAGSRADAVQEPAGGERILGTGTPLADLFLQVRINGDAAVLKGLMKALAEVEDQNPGTALDRDFIQKHTTGF